MAGKVLEKKLSGKKYKGGGETVMNTHRQRTLSSPFPPSSLLMDRKEGGIIEGRNFFQLVLFKHFIQIFLKEWCC